MTDSLPKIWVTDPAAHDRTAGSPTVESPSTLDGSQHMRPKSSSSDGNAQNGGKRSPVKLLRNPPSRSGGVSNPGSPTPADRPSTAIDPLSHHILKRTNTENTIPQKLRNAGSAESPTTEVGTPGSLDAPSARHVNNADIVTRSDSYNLKEKKKGASFLSRFSIISSKKKEQSEDAADDESEPGDGRTEGMNAHVFSSSVGANGYIPQHKEPPRYIKVRAHHKREREFNRTFLAQELSGSKPKGGDEKSADITSSDYNAKATGKDATGGAIWAMEFSKDGKYLAAAGRDQVVRVWCVISTPEERQQHEYEEDLSRGQGERLSAPVFRSKPVREFEGHTSEVLDLSWSKNNFLLSSSMDKTVRLWHVSRQECLCTFKHKDFVTSIAFHPTDDRFFLAGSLDSVLRLWSIPDKSVAFWNQLPDLITAVAFTPDGKTAMAGVNNGLCLFYDTEGLKFTCQIHVRSSRGKNAKGSKITGIRSMIFPPNDPHGEIKVLITSNDSRVRLYSLKDRNLDNKFRGLENTCSQIKATFSDNGQYIICGSEDKKAYIWSVASHEVDGKDKGAVELFEAHADFVTSAIFAPTVTRQLLGGSLDPLYDLCNPPPVTLLSRAESIVSSKAPTLADGEKRISDPTSEGRVRKGDLTPAYIARSKHEDGNIVVTADHSGSIKVFRQDCAFHKRRHDTWETASTFSKKLGPNGLLGRSGSIMTRGSSTHSRRNSVSHAPLPNLQQPSDRILSWRNSITSNASADAVGSIRTTRSDRSVSPGKFSAPPVPPLPTTTSASAASAARQQAYSTRTASASTVATMPPTPNFSLTAVETPSGLALDAAGKSNAFWSLSNWRASGVGATEMAANGNGNGNGSGGRAPMQQLSKQSTAVSRLSSEESSGSIGSSESEGEALVCRRCGSRDFRARKAGGVQRLVCTKCSMVAG